MTDPKLRKSGNAATTTTQGEYEADRWPRLLRELDEYLCEIISGNQGSFIPAHGTQVMAMAALKRLRAEYPLEGRPID